MALVYRITNKVTGKFYIGITRCTVAARWRRHRWDARRGKKGGLLHKSMRKHGESAFLVEVIHSGLTDEQAMALEIHEISVHNCLIPHGYNLSPGGFLPGPQERRVRHKGVKRSPETRERMRLAAIGRAPPSAETRLKLSLAGKGKRLSAEHRAKIKATKAGKLNPQFGKPRPDDVRLRIKEKMTGLKRPPEFGAQITERQRIKAPGAILNRDLVREIRAARRNGEMGKTLAARYGVSQQTISLVCNGTRWGHVDG